MLIPHGNVPRNRGGCCERGSEVLNSFFIVLGARFLWLLQCSAIFVPLFATITVTIFWAGYSRHGIMGPDYDVRGGQAPGFRGWFVSAVIAIAVGFICSPSRSPGRCRLRWC